jgi:hypothetical protein
VVCSADVGDLEDDEQDTETRDGVSCSRGVFFVLLSLLSMCIYTLQLIHLWTGSSADSSRRSSASALWSGPRTYWPATRSWESGGYGQVSEGSEEMNGIWRGDERYIGLWGRKPSGVCK